jgi:hypothetical protein
LKKNNAAIIKSDRVILKGNEMTNTKSLNTHTSPVNYKSNVTKELDKLISSSVIKFLNLFLFDLIYMSRKPKRTNYSE